MDKTRYFEFLLSLIPGADRYRTICQELFKINFRYDDYHFTDGNRADDGLNLRSYYFVKTRNVSFMGDEPCTVLEMIIALSLRIERDIMGEPGYDHPERWFEDMINNLGLLKLTSPRFIEVTVDRWLDRRFDSTGQGSLFPLKWYPGDQRDLCIWDQMSFYLNENY